MKKKITNLIGVCCTLAMFALLPSGISAQNDCSADAGMIATDDETTICADSQAAVEVYFSTMPSADYTTVFAITDDAVDPEILSVYQMMPAGGFGFDPYTGTNFQIWAINVEAPNSTLDALLAAIANGESAQVSDLEGLCWAASNPIAVTVEDCAAVCVVDPGCAADVNSAEYAAVIADDSWCCNTSWDGLCQDAYDDLGGLPNPSPECAQNPILGCTDANAINYNPDATEDDGSCEYPCAVDPGCAADVNSAAYAAVIDADSWCCDTSWDGLCQDAYDDLGGLPNPSPECTPDPILGCTDPEAINYNPEATEDNGSCEYETADGCYGYELIEYVQGTKLNGSALDANRTDATQALGQPDRVNAVGGFVSLGYGGSVSIAFDGAILDEPGDDILVWETSYASDDCLSDGIEAAQIELSQDGINWVPAGMLCRDGAIDIAVTGLPWITAIKVINDASSGTFDGYDVDGVEAINGCGPIPEVGCFGSEVLSYNPGPQNDGSPITDPERLDPTKALGAPQLDDTFNFVSLGYGGDLIVGFDGAVLNGPGADILVSETTFGNNTFATYPESADIFVSQNGTDFFLVGSLQTSQVDLFDISDAGQGFTYIIAVKVVDTTPDGSVSTDGFDVDAVEALNGCGPIPEIITGECYATEVVEYVEGTSSNGGAIPANRNDATQALGEPEGTDALVFVALGYDGSLTLGFDGAVPNGPGADLEIVETTYNFTLCENYPEFADVYVSQNGTDFFSVGTVCRGDNLVDIDDAGEGFLYINYVKIVNNNLLTTSSDGFDVDGVRAIHNCEDEEGDQPIPGIVAENESSVLSSQPNPTTGPSVAVFTVVETAPTTLEVFDMNGRNVSTLFNQVANEGQEYRVNFEGTFLPNGVYIYRLTTGNEVIIDKMMIAR